MIARRILVVLAVALIALPAAAQDQDAAMEAWTKAATPGPVHQFFAKMAGDWHIQASQWMQPGADPMVSESTSHTEMVLGGRFLVEHVKGTSMGMPFEGMGSLGYDNTTGTVTSTWIDNFGTVTTVMKGTYPEPGKPLEMSGTMIEPSSGMEMTMRSVTEFHDDGSHTNTMYMSMAGMPDMKAMVLEYTRK